MSGPLSADAIEYGGGRLVVGFLGRQTARKCLAEQRLAQSISSTEASLSLGIDGGDTGEQLVASRHQLLLDRQRRDGELDCFQTLRREMRDVRRNTNLTHEALGMQVPTEDHQSPFGKNILVGLKAQKAVGECHTFGNTSIQGRSADQVRALPFIEEHITVMKLVLLEDPGEIHLHDVRRVDAVLKDVCDAQVRVHLGTVVPVGVSSAAEFHRAGFFDGDHTPVAWRLLRDKLKKHRLPETFEPAARPLSCSDRSMETRQLGVQSLNNPLLLTQRRKQQANILKDLLVELVNSGRGAHSRFDLGSNYG